MRMRATILFLIIVCTTAQAATDQHWPLEKPLINLRDKASLQRGAQTFVNYCQGCHSAKFMRYRRLAKDIGITDKEGVINSALMRENLMLLTEKLGDTVQTAMSPEDAKKWFMSASPPDLSLITRKRGVDWLYTYLLSFYMDENRPWGVNNALFPSVAMPHVLVELQGIQKPVYKVVREEKNGTVLHEKKVLDRLELTKSGTVSAEEYKKKVADLVNFLSYVGEPMKTERQKLGVWVILFLVFFALVAFLLKQAYWKDVH